jgi:hypothetical protein
MNNLSSPDSVLQEERRIIPGYNGMYEIDRAGVVYATFPFKGQPAGRKLKTRIDRAGYVHTALSKNKRSQHRTIHRLVMLAWQPVENSHELDVNHIDGNKQNNHLSNLEWLSHADNIRHAGMVLNAWEKRNQRGDTAGHHKLTSADIRGIRILRDEGKTQQEIALVYGVSQENIGAILRGRTWGHVD